MPLSADSICAVLVRHHSNHREYAVRNRNVRQYCRKKTNVVLSPFSIEKDYVQSQGTSRGRQVLADRALLSLVLLQAFGPRCEVSRRRRWPIGSGGADEQAKCGLRI